MRIADDFACILAVTHIPHFREAFQTRIDVVKGKGRLSDFSICLNIDPDFVMSQGGKTSKMVSPLAK